MISYKVIKIASNTNFVGLKNKFTHKSTIKNPLCGDLIKVEFIANKTMIKSMRYETEACILCEASASLLAKKIKSFFLKDLEKDLNFFKEIKKNRNFSFPRKFKEFNQLLNENNANRINCVILPIEALSKAFKVNT